MQLSLIQKDDKTLNVTDVWQIITNDVTTSKKKKKAVSKASFTIIPEPMVTSLSCLFSLESAFTRFWVIFIANNDTRQQEFT